MPVTLSISALVKTPPSGRLLMEEALSTTVSGGNVVRCIDPEFKHQESFSFSKVFTDNDEYINTAYSSQIYPLVQRTIDGESTSVILSGPLSADTTTSHVLSSAGGKGLLSSAASDLISAAHRGGNSGAVTFSWLKIDSSPSEGLADILKSASATPAVAKTPTTSMVNSMGSYSTGTNSISGSVQSSGDMSLLVREIGKGRGMFVPGLWEVEIANGSDVDAVVSHVIQAVKNADHAKGGHTVFSLTYKPAHLRGGSALKTPSSASKSGSYQLAGSSSDPPGLGRITFIILASPGSTAHPPSIAASAAASPSTAPIPAYTTPSSTPWFAHLQSTLQWISQKRPSPPFHKSRVTLMLRDVLCSRQHAAWILLLPATAAALDANYAWLRLCAILSGGTSTTSLFTSTNGVKSVSYGTTFALDAARSRGSQGWSSPSPPSPMSLPRPQPIAATENEQVLAIQLASARQELDRVTIALATVQEELAATQRAYRELGAAMETTGSTLKKRDVEALHKAQADLKDYDVYRQVMEAALVRMQSELEVINSENKALRESSRTSTATRSSLKQQEEDKRAALKGYSNTKKALADAQDRLSEKDVLLKKVTKERDSLRTSLLVAHHSADSLKAKEEEISGLKKEIVDAKKRASHSASVERGYRLELDEVLVGHRNAISKVIELQKENAALHEMLESAGGSMRRRASSRPASPSGSPRVQFFNNGSANRPRSPGAMSTDSLGSRQSSPSSKSSNARTNVPQFSVQSSKSESRHSSIRNRLVDPPPPPPAYRDTFTHIHPSPSKRSSPLSRAWDAASTHSGETKDETGGTSPSPHAPPPPASTNTHIKYHPRPGSPRTSGSASGSVSSPRASNKSSFW